MPPHFVHGAGIGTGAAVVMTAQRHDRAARARPEFVRPRNADLFDGSLVRAEDSGGRGYLLLSPNESDALLASYGQVGVLDRTPTCVFKMQACSESIATSPRGFSGLPSLASMARWACFQASSLGTWCQLMLAIVARFAAPGKPRGLVVLGVRCATS
jgi:hypothetical protein